MEPLRPCAQLKGSCDSVNGGLVLRHTRLQGVQLALGRHGRRLADDRPKPENDRVEGAQRRRAAKKQVDLVHVKKRDRLRRGRLAAQVVRRRAVHRRRDFEFSTRRMPVRCPPAMKPCPMSLQSYGRPAHRAGVGGRSIKRREGNEIRSPVRRGRSRCRRMAFARHPARSSRPQRT